MARLVRGHPMPRSQQEGQGEPETNVSVPQQGGKEMPPEARSQQTTIWT